MSQYEVAPHVNRRSVPGRLAVMAVCGCHRRAEEENGQTASCLNRIFAVEAAEVVVRRRVAIAGTRSEPHDIFRDHRLWTAVVSVSMQRPDYAAVVGAPRCES